MIKRILGGAAAAGFAATLLVSGSATAAPCNTTGTNSQTPAYNKGEGTTLPNGTRIYRTPGNPNPTAPSGYIGVQGNPGAGWIEAGGSPSGGYISGKATGQPVDGRITGGTNGNVGVCAAERQVK